MALLITLDGTRVPVDSPAKAEVPCFRCGVCCVKWQPLLAPAELRRVAADLGLSLRAFNRRYTRPYPVRRGWRQFLATTAGCIFLGSEAGRTGCTIHGVRPQVCRDWNAALEKRECLQGLAAHRGPALMTPQHLYDNPDDAAALIAATVPRGPAAPIVPNESPIEVKA
jgi:Fe-S-cluster containining protein